MLVGGGDLREHTVMTSKLPMRPREHEIDEQAVTAFLSQKPASWAAREMSREYGRDLLVTVPAAPGLVGGDDFWVQMKGSEAPSYLADGKHLSHELKVTTLKYLRAQSSPAMLTVCDVGKATKPVYWVWIDDAIRDLEGRNPTWAQQDSATVRVPREQIFESTTESIEAAVKARHANDKIDRALSNFVRVLIGLQPDTPLQEAADTANYVKRELTPRLAKAGLVEVGERGEAVPYTPEQVAIREKIIKAGSLASVFKDQDVAAILAELETAASDMPPRLRAAFCNLNGVLAIHNDELEKAAAHFEAASSLNPNESQIAINLLTVQYSLTQKEATRWPLPDDWDRRLDELLHKKPDLVSGIRLKMWRLSQTTGVKSSNDFLLSSPISGVGREEALIALAEFYMFENDPGGALDLLESIENPPKGHEAHFFSIKAHSLTLKAIPGIRILEDGRVWIQGLGPTNIDLGLLQQACESYEKALAKIHDEAPLHVVEQIYASTASSWFLRGKYDRAIEVAQAFLVLHPDSKALNAAMAAALFQLRDPSNAVVYARKALDANEETGTSYRNLILILIASDHFDEALSKIAQRQSQGFSSSEEENLSYQMAAIAHAENGEFENAHSCINFLSEKGDGLAAMTLAEIEVWRRENKTSADLLARLRVALRVDSENPFLLTALIRELGWPERGDGAKANEMISAIETIAKSRQLIPVEFAALGHAYLAIDKVDDAERVLRSAIARYPLDPRFVFERAQVLAMAGREDEAYNALRGYLDQAKGDSLVYRNAAYLALTTGRLDDAIKLLRIALSRTTEAKERGELHSILWELRRRRGDTPTDLFGHVVEFGRTSDAEPDLEARFLMMCLLTPLAESDLATSEIAPHVKEFRERLAKFTQSYPNHRALKSVQVPLNLSDQEQAEHFMRELAYLTLPRRQVTEQLELAARGNPWPLCVRAVLLDPGGSPFSYWEKCIRSGDYMHAIHIFHSQLNLQLEDGAVLLGQPVVISLSGLLTLYQLDLINQIRKAFSLMIISHGTRSAISLALWSASNLPAPIARKLEDWINSNRDVVRVRTLAAEQMSDSDEVLTKVLGFGEGEAFLLARQLGYSLYSDEVSIRAEAWKRDIRTFSTISLLRSLRQRRFSRRDETILLSQMIALNFRYIPFDAETLQIALAEAVWTENDPRSLAIENRLRTHAVIGPFLNQFSEQHVTWDSLMRVVRNWWPMLLGSAGIPDGVIERILHLVSFVGMQRLMPRLGPGLTPPDIAAEIYAGLLMETRGEYFGRAWTIIKHCVESAYRRDEDILKFNNERIPDGMVRILRSRQLSPSDASAMLSPVVRRLAYDELEAWKARLRAVHCFATE